VANSTFLKYKHCFREGQLATGQAAQSGVEPFFTCLAKLRLVRPEKRTGEKMEDYDRKKKLIGSLMTFWS
jgi:hypothetical protein